MFKLFFKKKEEKKVEKVIDKSKYNGAVYRGVFKIGDKIVEGAYIRDGLRTFVTEDGVAMVSKQVKLQQIESKPVSDVVEHYVDCVKNGYVTPFTTI